MSAAAMRGGLILGSARCGSTLLSEILRRHPDVLSVSELFSTAGPHAFRPARPSGARFWSRLATPSRALSRVGNPDAAPREFLYGRVPAPEHDPHRCPPILAIALPHLFPDPDAAFRALGASVPAWGPRPLADHYRALFAVLAERSGGRGAWVERSGGSLVAAGTLRAMFPEAALVLLLRDGADTALSMRDYPATRLAIWTWRRLRPFGIDLLAERGHFGRGAIWPAIAAVGGHADLRAILEAPPSLADCGAFWSAVTRAGLRGLDGAAPLVVSYEALCRDPEPEIDRLGRHLAGSAPEAWRASTRGLPRAGPSRAAALPRDERRALADACAPGEAALADWLRGRDVGGPGPRSTGHAPGQADGLVRG